MFLILFRRLIFLLLGIGILILGAVLKNFIIIFNINFACDFDKL